MTIIEWYTCGKEIHFYVKKRQKLWDLILVFTLYIFFSFFSPRFSKRFRTSFHFELFRNSIYNTRAPPVVPAIEHRL